MTRPATIELVLFIKIIKQSNHLSAVYEPIMKPRLYCISVLPMGKEQTMHYVVVYFVYFIAFQYKPCYLVDKVNWQRNFPRTCLTNYNTAHHDNHQSNRLSAVFEPEWGLECISFLPMGKEQTMPLLYDMQPIFCMLCITLWYLFSSISLYFDTNHVISLIKSCDNVSFPVPGKPTMTWPATIELV